MQFNLHELVQTYSIANNTIHCLVESQRERLAQIIADFLRKKLLKERKRFSFETVFSHNSKLDIMRDAVTAGYKVYLYFVCTESPEINKFRVKARTKKGGHDVPVNKIETRYYRALDLYMMPLNWHIRLFSSIILKKGEILKCLPILKLSEVKRFGIQLVKMMFPIGLKFTIPKKCLKPNFCFSTPWALIFNWLKSFPQPHNPPFVFDTFIANK